MLPQPPDLLYACKGLTATSVSSTMPELPPADICLTCPQESISCLDILAYLHISVSVGCDMQESLPGLLRDTHITAMVHGNFTAQESFEMASSVRKMLSDGIMTASERSVDRVVVLPHGTTLHM